LIYSLVYLSMRQDNTLLNENEKQIKPRIEVVQYYIYQK